MDEHENTVTAIVLVTAVMTCLYGLMLVLE